MVFGEAPHRPFGVGDIMQNDFRACQNSGDPDRDNRMTDPPT